jgi:hypothetical protein
MATVAHLGLLPWCDSLNSSDGSFAVATPITRSEALLLYWKAKRIGVREFYEESVNFSMGGVSLAYSEPQSPVISSEEQLVCGTNYVSHNQIASAGSDSVNIEASCSFSFSLFYNEETTGPENEFLLLGGGEVTAGGIWIISQGTPLAALFSPIYTSALPDQTGGSTPYISSTLTLNGRLIEFNSRGFSKILGPSLRPIGNPETIAANIGSIVLDPPAANFEIFEYWPYDPGDGGGPIYDSATGAQLREF